MKHIIKKFLFVLSTILFVVFILTAIVCLIKNYFYSFFTYFFAYLDSVGITTTALLTISICSLIGGLFAYFVFDKI